MKNTTFEKTLNIFGIVLGISIVIFLIMTLTSCGTLTTMSDKEKELEYRIDKLYLEYSYQRDSLILEHHKNK